MTGELQRVLVVGGGFAGLRAVQELAASPVRVTLLDRRNHHLFQPLLYQVATAALAAPDIARPLRSVFRGAENVRVLLGEVREVDAAAREVVLDDRRIAYDWLILAAGATHDYFGHDEWARHAPGLKTLADALDIRNRMLRAFEAAELAEDGAARDAWLTFVVVGGGPTGVELAGALAEISRVTLQDEFRSFSPEEARVVLMEGGPRLLAGFPEELSAAAAQQLEGLGVEVRTAALVEHVDAAGVVVAGERTRARTVLWAAGVAASPLARGLGAPLDRAGRVEVEEDLSVPGHPEVFVAGDLAHVEQDGQVVPGVAPAAIQEGRHAARQVLRRLRGQPTEPFRYRDKGALATIGRSRAVARLGSWKLSGFLAWVLWGGVHIFFLIGFRNRVRVMLEWLWAWFVGGRGARLLYQDPVPGRPPDGAAGTAEDGEGGTRGGVGDG